MSVLVAGLCYEVAFGCPKRKAIAVALADHASHDGTNVFPSIKLIAAKVEYSERTVQRTLRDLEQIGLLTVVSAGGAGPKDTREWAFNMHLLRALADGTAKIIDDKGDSETPLEGDSLTPLDGLRVTGFELRVTETTAKGDSSDTRTVTNHHLEPSTREGAPATQSAARPSLEVKPRLVKRGDTHWRLWLNWLTGQGHSLAAQHIEREGAMVVYADRPMTGVALPKLPPLDPEKLAKLEREREPVRVVRDPTGEAA